MKSAPKNPIQERPKQKLPSEISEDLLRAIQNQFYPDSFTSAAGAKQWAQDKHFIQRRVVLWPAGWLNKKGITLKPERYQQILLDIFRGIKHHGNTGAVKFWPGYLAHCVQSHFKIHEEEIYNEGKSLRNALDHTLLSLGKTTKRQDDVVATMSEALKVLESSRRKKTAPPRSSQLTFL